MRFVIILLFSLFSLSISAHQVDVSSTMLVEQSEGNWVLQIRAALTAFQYEVRSAYGEDSYKSPEDFKLFVKELVAKNVDIKFNQGTQCSVSDIQVNLGHETTVFMNVLGVPNDIQEVFVQNSLFQNVHKNRSALIVLKKGLDKNQFVLNEDNNHRLDLIVEGSKFAPKYEEISSSQGYTAYIFFGLLSLVLIGFSMYILIKKT